MKQQNDIRYYQMSFPMRPYTRKSMGLTLSDILSLVSIFVNCFCLISDTFLDYIYLSL